MHSYLYVILSEKSFPALRNSSRALMASFVEYHRCGCGRLDETSLKKNLLCLLAFDIPLRLESGELNELGLMSGNSTM
jgi:hypothetical protein